MRTHGAEFLISALVTGELDIDGFMAEVERRLEELDEDVNSAEAAVPSIQTQFHCPSRN